MPYWKIFRNCNLPKNFPIFSTQKKSLKFAGRIGRFLRNYKILQILSQNFILSKKAKACSQKILQFIRSVTPIRYDVEHYKDYLDYELDTIRGIHTSYEREYYD
jgi:arginyl-tRNA--protein-N-Asp/Glu arginylyltransferase